MLPGETIRSGASLVCECGTRFELEVMKSAAGYYVGTQCRNQECKECGIPNSRESHYYYSQKECETALKNGTVNWRT